jgi:uncharacterized protein
VEDKISVSYLSAKRSEAVNKKFFADIKKRHPKNLDRIVQNIHEKVFTNINCLDCANCCKSISPILRDKDIERISRHLKIRPAVFTEKFLMIDKDNDFVFQIQPCPFLLPDNYCNIYSVRPKACSEYPHTSQPNFITRLDLTVKNSFYCPAVVQIIEKLKKEKIN